MSIFLTDVQPSIQKLQEHVKFVSTQSEYFGIDATWVFFATSHGKSPCDGIGGTVKRLTARASLQRPYSEQILDVSSMLDFCKTNIPGIAFIYISKERMEEVRADLKERFAMGHTIPGTRSYHLFTPVSTNVIAYKRIRSFNITGEPDVDGVTTEAIRLNEYVACRYDENVVEEVNEVEEDVKINFLHPPGPERSFSLAKQT